MASLPIVDAVYDSSVSPLTTRLSCLHTLRRTVLTLSLPMMCLRPPLTPMSNVPRMKLLLMPTLRLSFVPALLRVGSRMMPQ